MFQISTVKILPYKMWIITKQKSKKNKKDINNSDTIYLFKYWIWKYQFVFVISRYQKQSKMGGLNSNMCYKER